MGKDIRLVDAATQKTIQLAKPHYLRGSTYCPEGTTAACISVTYNYVHVLRRVIDLGQDRVGIRALYGMTAHAARPVLECAIARLGLDAGDDYWEPTEGNVRRALESLLDLATLSPQDAIIQGD